MDEQNQQPEGNNQMPSSDTKLAQSYDEQKATLNAQSDTTSNAGATQSQQQPPAMPPSASPAFSEPVKKGGRSKSRTFCVCCCSLVVLLIVILGGLVVFAAVTDTEIPIISDIVEKIEEMTGSSESKAEKVQEQVASSVIQTIFPFVTSDEGVISTFAESNLTEASIEQFVQDYDTIESFRFDADMTLDIEGTPEVVDEDMPIDIQGLDVKMTGALDGKQKGNEKLDTTFDIEVSTEGIDVNATGALRAVGADMYLKIDTLPDLGFETDDIRGKWVDIGAEEVEDVANTIDSEASESDTEEITEEDMQKLYDFIVDDSISQNVEVLENENIEGNESECVKFSWNAEELQEVIKRFNEIYEEEYNEDEVKESLEGLELLSVEVCIGIDSKDIHKIGVHYVAEENGQDYDITVTMKLWDYGADMGIAAPSEYMTSDEFYELLMGVPEEEGYGPADDGTYYDFSDIIQQQELQ